METLEKQLDAGDDPFQSFSQFFKPLKMLGQGAFGKVVQGIDIATGEELAIKVVSKKKMGEDFIKRVKYEARILEQMNHPNVVSFKKVCETDTRILIAMELVKGGSLGLLMKERAATKQWLSEKDVSEIMRNIMQGLAYIHAQNIVHRDLKPENILIGDQNDLSTVKIADFGLSSAFSVWTSSGLTEQCGTLLYMAPEFFLSRTYSKQIDIWSCGITMFFLLDRGRHPFYDPNVDDSDSFKEKLASPKWKFPSHFSNLARNLLEKLSLFCPTERYSAVQVLQHPFITAKDNGIIPMTMHEQFMCLDTLEKISKTIKGMMFLQYLSSVGETVKIIKDSSSLSLPQIEKSQNTLIPSEKKSASFQKPPRNISVQKQKADCANSYSPINQLGNAKKRNSFLQPKENIIENNPFQKIQDANNCQESFQQSNNQTEQNNQRSKSQIWARHTISSKRKAFINKPHSQQQDYTQIEGRIDNFNTQEDNRLEFIQIENKRNRISSACKYKGEQNSGGGDLIKPFSSIKNVLINSVNLNEKSLNIADYSFLPPPPPSSNSITENSKENKNNQIFGGLSSVRKKSINLQQKQEPQQYQPLICELQAKNRIPLRGFSSLLQNRILHSKSINGEDEKNNQDQICMLPALKEKKGKVPNSSNIQQTEQERKKGYLMNTKARENHLFSKKLCL